MKLERARHLAHRGLPEMVQVLRTARTTDRERRNRLVEGVVAQLGVSFAGDEVNNAQAANRELVIDLLVMRVQGRIRSLERICRPRLVLDQFIREAPCLLLLARAVAAAGLGSGISDTAGRALLLLHEHQKATRAIVAPALAG